MGSLALFVMGACNTFAAGELFPAYARNTRLLAIAQLQYFFVGYALFGGWAALYYGLAKTGRLANDARGTWSFWLMFAGFNVAFFPSSLRSGLPPLPSDVLRLFAGQASWEACAGAYVFAAGFLLGVWTVARALVDERHRP
jgi:heme/copper-type cytochrome/quinol oxidase subunit 1